MGAGQGQLIVLTKFRYLKCYYYHWDYRSACGLLVPEAHYHWDYRSAGGLLVPEAHTWFIRHIYV